MIIFNIAVKMNDVPSDELIDNVVETLWEKLDGVRTVEVQVVKRDEDPA